MVEDIEILAFSRVLSGLTQDEALVDEAIEESFVRAVARRRRFRNAGTDPEALAEAQVAESEYQIEMQRSALAILERALAEVTDPERKAAILNFKACYLQIIGRNTS